MLSVFLLIGTLSAAAASPGALPPSPIDLLQVIGEAAERELVAVAFALPHLPYDLALALGRAPTLGDDLWRASLLVTAVLAVHVAVMRLTRRARQRAAAERVPVAAMVKLTGWELLPLLASVAIARFAVVQVLHYPAGAAAFPADVAQNLIRWLTAVTFLAVVFRPDHPQLRLIDIDGGGAALAVRRGAGIFAIGYLQAVATASLQRAGLPIETVKLVAFLSGAAMIVAALHLLFELRRRGLRQTVLVLAVLLVSLTFALWIWGWVEGEFDLYRGVKATVGSVLLALVFDRALALSIRLSRRPGMIRTLFVLRVAIGAVASAIILRVAVDYWLVGTFALVPLQEWPAYSRRLNFACLVLVTGALLAATTHAWIEARMSPPLAVESEEEKETRQARLSTFLPTVRVAMLVLIAVVFSLIALSALGLDITPVMAGAGILGLAVSLGAQALVKDVIAGIFCMLDDVFRLGELIEIGPVRGRVEQITLRSLRLRSLDDRLHTVPFGEIATVTSHSRRLVAVSAAVPLHDLPDIAVQQRFGRVASAALRSEAPLLSAMVGKIATRALKTEDGEPALIVSFQAARAAAVSAEQVIAGLVAEAAEDCGLQPAGRIRITMADVREPESGFLAPPIPPSTP